MKLWIAFIAALVISQTRLHACGFYPFDEDVRFHLLDPNAFGYRGFAPFFYTTAQFAEVPELIPDTAHDANVLQWAAYCKRKVPLDEIQTAVYNLPIIEMGDSNSTNAMVRYLHRKHDTAALSYLAFAKRCEPYNSFSADLWERSENYTSSQQRAQSEAAVLLSKMKIQQELRARYAFLAIRMAYYNDDLDMVKQIWTTQFARRKLKSTIDYWAMHFRALAEENPAYKNYLAAQVFYHAPEKRLQTFQRYARMPVSDYLRFAGTTKERAAVWLFEGVHNPGPAFKQIEGLAQQAPRDPALGFLVLREISKLEDWIYTPTYTYFSPSLRVDSWEDVNVRRNTQNVPKDRAYAARLRRFVNARQFSAGKENAATWGMASAYLAAMSSDYREALRQLTRLERKMGGRIEIASQVNLFRTIWTVAATPVGRADLSALREKIMSGNLRQNNRFLFALGRELEMKGNTTDAALIFSRLNAETTGGEYVGDGSTQWVFWKSPRHTRRLYMDFFSDYFYYLDAQYSPAQLTALLKSIPKVLPTDSFSNWKYATVIGDRERLKDMLGTKYIRRNDLQHALSTFEQVEDSIYSSPYYGYKVYFAANPFYTNFYNEHTPTNADTIVYTKAALTRQLIRYLELAENPATKNRSYYFYLVATAYLNMTQYGNSWMMRRFYWTSSDDPTGMEDDREYYGALLAKAYYLKAKAATKNRMAQALCIRMAGRCEKYRLMWSGNKLQTGETNEKDLYGQNIYWKQLKESYPEYAEEMLSNCMSFDRYYASMHP